VSVAIAKQIPHWVAGDVWLFLGTGDPSVAPGWAAGIGSEFSDTSTGARFFKIGPLDTDWSVGIGSGGGGGGTGATSVLLSPDGSALYSPDSSPLIPAT
jgi:hypothetical protein